MSHRICSTQQILLYLHECENNEALKLISKTVKLIKSLAVLFYGIAIFVFIEILKKQISFGMLMFFFLRKNKFEFCRSV